MFVGDNWIPNAPLVEKRANAELGGLFDIATVDRSSSIYFGIGLTGIKELSACLPIDVLSMIMMAEYARRRLQWTGKVYILLADTHAIAVGKSEDDIKQKTTEIEANLATVCDGLGLGHFIVMRASRICYDSRYQMILRYGFSQEPEYARYQLTDFSFLHLDKEVRLKISWSLGGVFKPGVRDERCFDYKLRKKEWRYPPEFPMFVYCKAGRTFDPACPQTAPYLSMGSRYRLILDRKSNAIDFLETVDCSMKKTVKYLQDLTDLFELVVAPLSSDCLGVRLQNMLDLVYGRA